MEVDRKREQIKKDSIDNKVDNFFEAIYCAPQLFGKEVFHNLKKREEQLKVARNAGQLICGSSFLFLYAVFKLKTFSCKYYIN